MGSGKKHKKDREKEKDRDRDAPVSAREQRAAKRRRESPPPSAAPVVVVDDSSASRRRERRPRRRHSPDVEEVPLDSHLRKSPPPEKRSKVSEPENVSGSKSESLSIEETNKLRAKLGLKPLQVTEEVSADDGKIKDDLGEFYHKPADNIADKKRQEVLRSKISERREKRQIESKLLTTVTLADSDDEDGDAAAWIQKNREVVKQKEEAAKRAAILDELDAEFGIGDIAAQEERDDRRSAYTANSLKGMTVKHDLDSFQEDRVMILTLEDKPVLDDSDDVLVNVNLKDDERYKKSNENKKGNKEGYDPFEGMDDPELYGQFPQKKVLKKYDEEIYGQKKSGFVIGDADGEEMRKFKQMMIKEKLSSKHVESLVLPELKIASEYYTEEEMKAKFKKTKKKGKLRKKVKEELEEEDLQVIEDADDADSKPEMKFKVEEEQEEEDNELEMALAKSRKLKLAENLKLPKLEEIVSIKQEEEEEKVRSAGGIILDSTAEFCRTLGDIPTYGQAGNRDVDAEELMEIERSVEPETSSKNNAEGTWNSVDVETDQPVDVTRDGGGALAAEPTVGAGLAGALKLALSKGYLERGREARTAPPALSNLRAHHYSIDDKAHGEDEKLNRRERGYTGPTLEFREKDGFKPNVKLDYVDDDGRTLPPKEAFRYLSHKFHGKGPGKNKQEKRIKQTQQEGLMKKMSSTDTPLGTLALLQARQKEAKAAFVVLSGAKQPRTSGP